MAIGPKVPFSASPFLYLFSAVDCSDDAAFGAIDDTVHRV